MNGLLVLPAAGQSAFPSRGTGEAGALRVAHQAVVRYLYIIGEPGSGKTEAFVQFCNYGIVNNLRVLTLTSMHIASGFRIATAFVLRLCMPASARIAEMRT